MIVVLQLGQLAEALGHQPGRHLAVEVGRVRAVLAAVGEEAAPVELGRLDEAQQLVVVALGLARVADDEVAAEGGVRLAPADVVDAPQEAVAVAPAAHPPQQRLADVLQRQVEVRHAGVADGVDEVVAEVARVEVQQADPVDAVGDGTHERDDGAGAELVGDVLAVRREVLGDEHDLPRLQLVDLGEDRGHRPAALRTAERRDGAEPARAVAALGDLDVRPRARRPRPGQVEQVEQRAARRALTGIERCGARVGGRASSVTPNPATWSTSGRAAASSSP